MDEIKKENTEKGEDVEGQLIIRQVVSVEERIENLQKAQDAEKRRFLEDGGWNLLGAWISQSRNAGNLELLEKILELIWNMPRDATKAMLLGGRSDALFAMEQILELGDSEEEKGPRKSCAGLLKKWAEILDEAIVDTEEVKGRKSSTVICEGKLIVLRNTKDVRLVKQMYEEQGGKQTVEVKKGLEEVTVKEEVDDVMEEEEKDVQEEYGQRWKVNRKAKPIVESSDIEVDVKCFSEAVVMMKDPRRQRIIMKKKTKKKVLKRVEKGTGKKKNVLKVAQPKRKYVKKKKRLTKREMKLEEERKKKIEESIEKAIEKAMQDLEKKKKLELKRLERKNRKEREKAELEAIRAKEIVKKKKKVREDLFPELEEKSGEKQEEVGKQEQVRVYKDKKTEELMKAALVPVPLGSRHLQQQPAHAKSSNVSRCEVLMKKLEENRVTPVTRHQPVATVAPCRKQTRPPEVAAEMTVQPTKYCSTVSLPPKENQERYPAKQPLSLPPIAPASSPVAPLSLLPVHKMPPAPPPPIISEGGKKLQIERQRQASLLSFDKPSTSTAICVIPKSPPLYVLRKIHFTRSQFRKGRSFVKVTSLESVVQRAREYHVQVDPRRSYLLYDSPQEPDSIVDRAPLGPSPDSEIGKIPAKNIPDGTYIYYHVEKVWPQPRSGKNVKTYQVSPVTPEQHRSRLSLPANIPPPPSQQPQQQNKLSPPIASSCSSLVPYLGNKKSPPSSSCSSLVPYLANKKSPPSSSCSSLVPYLANKKSPPSSSSSSSWNSSPEQEKPRPSVLTSSCDDAPSKISPRPAIKPEKQRYKIVRLPRLPPPPPLIASTLAKKAKNVVAFTKTPDQTQSTLVVNLEHDTEPEPVPPGTQPILPPYSVPILPPLPSDPPPEVVLPPPPPPPEPEQPKRQPIRFPVAKRSDCKPRRNRISRFSPLPKQLEQQLTRPTPPPPPVFPSTSVKTLPPSPLQNELKCSLLGPGPGTVPASNQLAPPQMVPPPNYFQMPQPGSQMSFQNSGNQFFWHPDYAHRNNPFQPPIQLLNPNNTSDPLNPFWYFR